MATKTYNGHTYKLSTAGTWQEAQAQAQKSGGNLVTINDKAEQDWIAQTFKYDLNTQALWIGLTDQETEGDFKWINGEPLTYTNWASGEPNKQVSENKDGSVIDPETVDYTMIYTKYGYFWGDTINNQKFPNAIKGIIEIGAATSGTDSQWVDKINTPALKEKLQAFLSDSKLSLDETKQLFLAADAGGVDTNKLKDLNAIWTNAKTLFADDYTQSLADNIINGNSANQYWWGALDKTGKKELGDINFSTPEGNLTKLVAKWFLGSDEPLPLVGGDTANVSLELDNFKLNYKPFTGELFKDGVRASDVHQGTAGTCYLMASLGAIANVNPSLIEKDFISDNGDGTYAVRLFDVNGEKHYVTVDNNLAVNEKGQAALAKPFDGELWVSLVEKAYAQANAQDGLLLRSNNINSFQAVEGGLAAPLKQITGLNYNYYSGQSDNWNDGFNSGETKYSTDPQKYKAEIISKLNNGSIGWMASWADVKDSNNKVELVSKHAFMLMGYDAKSDTFKIRNPWGDTSPDNYYVAEFNLPIEKFWKTSSIALTDAAIKNVDYKYTITSSSDSSEKTTVEGDSVDFTITRDSVNTTSIVYYSIKPVDTNTDLSALDHPEITKEPVEFLSGVKNKNLSIPIFTDALKEGTESFNIELYKSLDDTEPYAKSTYSIKDGAIDKFNYLITSSEEVTIEGNQLVVTIERDGDGQDTTLYLDTTGGTATQNLDFAAQSKIKVNFKANEKIAHVPINIFTDAVDEKNETLGVSLYRYFTDTKPMVNRDFIIADAPKTKDYNYIFSSNASSVESAIDEGSPITFTVKRNGTGTESTVYLKVADGSAFAGGDFNDQFAKELAFKEDQDTLTFTVETFADFTLEATEVVNLELYKQQVSDKPNAVASGYIKDIDQSFSNYTITSNAPDSKSAVKEGNDVIFTITRSNSTDEATIYADTFDGKAVGSNKTWNDDYQTISKQELTFAPGETSKTVTVNTYTDDKTTEGVENFNLGIHQFKTDTIYSDYASASVKDVIPDSYSYKINSDYYAQPKGEDINITITRSGTGSESTVYIQTQDGSATAASGDYEALNMVPVTFNSDETEKKLTFKTFENDVTDEPVFEYIFIDVYKYFDGSDSQAYTSVSFYQKQNEIDGTDKKENLIGTDGQDNIYGQKGDDTIYGGGNQDYLHGGDGMDPSISGKDTYVFKSTKESTLNLPDHIEDWNTGDKVDLKAIDANVNIKGDQAFSKPVVGKVFSGVFTKPGQLFYDSDSSTLYGNVDSDSNADFAIVMSGQASQVTTVSANDFIL